MSELFSTPIKSGEPCRICKKPISNPAAAFELKNGFACAHCVEKTSASFCRNAKEYSSEKVTAGIFKKNMAYRKENRKRYESFTPLASYSRYVVDHLIAVDMEHRFIAFYPTKYGIQQIDVDFAKMKESKACEIFSFDEIKNMDILDDTNSDLRYIRLTLTDDKAGFDQFVCIQRDENGKENTDLDSVSLLLALILKSRRIEQQIY